MFDKIEQNEDSQVNRILSNFTAKTSVITPTACRASANRRNNDSFDRKFYPCCKHPICDSDFQFRIKHLKKTCDVNLAHCGHVV